MSTHIPVRSAQPSAPGLFLRASWKKLLLLWVIVLPVVGILLANDAALDTAAWRATRWFMGSQDAFDWHKSYVADAPAGTPWYYATPSPLNGRIYNRTEKTWRLLRDLGEVQLTVVLIAVVWIFHWARWRAAAVLAAATACAGVLSWLIRAVGGRYRPDAVIDGITNAGGNYWQFFRGFHSTADLSFPSGHSTLAFATAAVLTYFFPRGRYLFIVIAGGCALARVVMQAHFYSDILFGSALGWTVGSLTAPLLMQRLAPEMERLAAE